MATTTAAKRGKRATGDRKPAVAAATPSIRIHFEDHGQDFLWWDLQDRDDGYSYAVVDCGPFQAWLWTKYFVAKASVKKGKRPLITQDEISASPLKYQITRVEKLKSTAAKTTDTRVTAQDDQQTLR